MSVGRGHNKQGGNLLRQTYHHKLLLHFIQLHNIYTKKPKCNHNEHTKKLSHSQFKVKLSNCTYHIIMEIIRTFLNK